MSYYYLAITSGFADSQPMLTRGNFAPSDLNRGMVPAALAHYDRAKSEWASESGHGPRLAR